MLYFLGGNFSPLIYSDFYHIMEKICEKIITYTHKFYTGCRDSLQHNGKI